MDKHVQQTILSKVYDVAIISPLDMATKLTTKIGSSVYLKREDLQSVHSFKLRGAYNKIAQLSKAEQQKGIIAASAGNHAQGVALSAQKLGLKATIVMPRTAPQIKVDAVRSYGASVVLYGDSFSEAYAHCQQLVEQTGMTFVHPFDDPLVIAGQGTIGKEIIEQLPDVTHIFIPIGGGGLIAGIAQYVKTISPDVQIIGVEPTDSDAMQQSLAAHKRVELEHVGIFADGVAVKQVGEHTFDICQRYVDDVVTVTNDEICAAIKDIFEETRSIVEPSGALAVAGINKQANAQSLKPTDKLVAICSGANMPFERLQFIAERTMLGSNREALFAVTIPEEQGALYAFCKDIVDGHNITEFNYRCSDPAQARIFVGVSIANSDDKQNFIQKLEKFKYEFSDLSHNDIAKEHIRHMIGGSLSQNSRESLYEIRFPERAGALVEFLQATNAQEQSISLFHYRSSGGDTAKVMIGFQPMHTMIFTPSKLPNAFEATSLQNNLAARYFL